LRTLQGPPEPVALVRGSVQVASKEREESYQSSIIAGGFRLDGPLYDMSVDGKIPRTSGHFFEGDDYPVTERTIFLAESVEQRVHRAGGGNFAQRWGNVEPYITRDVGIQKHFAQGCNCNITV